jgi:hypothetical protein
MKMGDEHDEDQTKKTTKKMVIHNAPKSSLCYSLLFGFLETVHHRWPGLTSVFKFLTHVWGLKFGCGAYRFANNFNYTSG